jgi:arsenate reductase
VRTKESVWIENYKNKELSAAEIIEAMLKHPKLIERPIIVYGEKAIIARPKERIKELIR